MKNMLAKRFLYMSLLFFSSYVVYFCSEVGVESIFSLPIEPYVALILGCISSIATFGILISLCWFIMICWNNCRTRERSILLSLIIPALLYVLSLTHDWIVLSPFFVTTGDARSAVFAFLKLMFQ